MSRFAGRRSRYDAQSAPTLDPALTSPIAMWAGTITTGATFTWSDLSGHGLDLVQATAGAQPAKNASSSTFGGQPSISFAGAQGLGTAGNISLGTTFEIVLVGTITGVATNRVVIETSAAGAGGTVGAILAGYNWTSPASTGWNLLVHGEVNNVWNAVNAPASPCVVSLFCDLTATPDVEDFRYNNVSQTVVSSSGPDGNANPLVALPIFFGSRAGAGAVGPITGEFAFCAIWARARPESERAAVNAFLRARYGV